MEVLCDFAETYRDIVEIDKNQVIVISLSESSSAAEVISQWVKGRAQNIQSSHQLVSYIIILGQRSHIC